MKNKRMFDIANATNDSKLKGEIREAFLSWCQKNGRTPMNPEAIQDWWKEDYTEC